MPTIVGTPGYRALKGEWSLTDDGDKWGDTLMWHFAVAEVLYHNGHDIPEHWEFRDSPLHDDDSYFTDVQDYPTQAVIDLYVDGEVDEVDLTVFGNVLYRYANLLRESGEDY